MNPISVQNTMQAMDPKTQIIRAIVILFKFFPISESERTVETLSTKAKAESTPSKKNIKKSIRFQKLGNGISDAAVGRAIYAKPKEATSLDTGLFVSLRYPIIEKTVNPQIKLMKELDIVIMKLSIITGLSLGL